MPPKKKNSKPSTRRLSARVAAAQNASGPTINTPAPGPTINTPAPGPTINTPHSEPQASTVLPNIEELRAQWEKELREKIATERASREAAEQESSSAAAAGISAADKPSATGGSAVGISAADKPSATGGSAVGISVADKPSAVGISAADKSSATGSSAVGSSAAADEGSAGGIGMPSPALEKGRRPQIKWTPEMTTVMLRSLVKQIRLGKRSDNGFKAEVWTAVANEVLAFDSSQPFLDGPRCQSKLDALKKKYDVWNRIKGRSGFGWDKERGVPTAPDEVWEEAIRKTPAIKEFRHAPLANLPELGEILDGVRATGQWAIYPGVPPVDPVLLDPEVNETMPSSPLGGSAAPFSSPLAPRTGYQRERPQSVNARLAASIETLSETADLNFSKTRHAVAKCRKTYKGKEGWDSEDLYDAYKLFENTTKAEIFLALEGDEEEEEWLRREIRRM